MQKLEVFGANKLKGLIKISGSKNASLPILAATLLSNKKTILKNLDEKINPSPWIFGKEVSLLDISILPFIRQCKIANPDWFFAQDFAKIIDLLNYFENGDLFAQAMQKYELWDPVKNNGNMFP